MTPQDKLTQVQRDNTMLRLELALLRNEQQTQLDLVYANVENRKLKRAVEAERRNLVRAHIASQKAS